jgi:hypothetical protein
MTLLWLALACTGNPTPPTDAPADPADKLLAELRAHPLELTAHARCRMDCRHIDRHEIEELLVDGTWIPDRTRHDGPCPSHAIEGLSDDGQRLRVVYAACPDETRVVTAIDLGRDHPCDCP